VFVILAASQIACAQGPVATPPAQPVFDTSAYHWLAEESAALPPLAPLQSVFAAPEHADRVPVADDSFGSWLRGLPVRTDRHHVLSYEGRRLAAHSAGVILLDLGERKAPVDGADAPMKINTKSLERITRTTYEEFWQTHSRRRFGFEACRRPQS
jgi:hypothetical protein